MFAPLSLLQRHPCPSALRRSLVSLASFTGPQVAVRAKGSTLQREIFATDSSADLLTLIRSAARQERFDPSALVAASQRLSHLASRLAPELEDVPDILEAAVLQHLPQFSVDQVASALLAMVRLEPADSQRQALLEGAARTSSAAVLQQACTEHNVSLLVAFAELGATADQSPEVLHFVRRLTAELQSRLVDGPVLQHTRIADSQLPDLCWSFARVHAKPEQVQRFEERGISPTEPPGPQSGSVKATLQPESAGLMDSIAGRARSHLANRHSAKATFAPGEVALLAASFALVGHISPEVSSLLDALMGFATRRILTRHLNAVSRLDHTATLLWAVALLQHRSIATRELLQASSSEVAHQLASAEASTAQSTHPPSSASDLVAILAAHWQLGFCPADKLLVALPPYICRRRSALSVQQSADLSMMLQDFGHPPGAVLQQLLDD